MNLGNRRRRFGREGRLSLRGQRKGGNVGSYELIMKENGRLFTAEPILAKLPAVYSLTDEAKMAKGISEIMVMCSEKKNRHLP